MTETKKGTMLLWSMAAFAIASTLIPYTSIQDKTDFTIVLFVLPLGIFLSMRYINCMRLGFAPFYWAFLFYTLFVFLIPGTFQVSNDNYYWFWSGGYDKTIIAVAILFLYLAIGSFELGYRFGFGSAGRFSNSTPRRHRAGERALPARSPSRQVVMIVVGAAAGLLVLAILQIGIEGFIGTRAAVSARFQEIAGASNVSRGIFSALVRQISIIALLFSLWYFISKWKKDVYAT